MSHELQEKLGEGQQTVGFCYGLIVGGLTGCMFTLIIVLSILF